MAWKGGCYVEWRIENLSHWSEELHGVCITSPECYVRYCSNIQLYPKGERGRDEHVVVRFSGVKSSFDCNISFHCADGTLLGTQSVKQPKTGSIIKTVLFGSRCPPGPKFEDVLSRIREEDLLIVRCRLFAYPVEIFSPRIWQYYEECISTTLNVYKTSLKINPKLMRMNAGESTAVYFIKLLPDDAMWLYARREKDALEFRFRPPSEFEFPFAVEACLRITSSDGAVISCETKEQVFREKNTWTFPVPLDKKELQGKTMALFLCLKTKHAIRNPSYANLSTDYVSIEPYDKISSSDEKEPSADDSNKVATEDSENSPCFPEKESSADSNKDSVLTKDSESQTSDEEFPEGNPHRWGIVDASPVEGSSIDPNTPEEEANKTDDSVDMLSKDLMCLFQDQDFSDFQLKCDNVTFPVHKNILSARSPVFKIMLSSGMAEAATGQVVIGDLSPSALSLLLTYLYTGTVEDLQSE